MSFWGLTTERNGCIGEYGWLKMGNVGEFGDGKVSGRCSGVAKQNYQTIDNGVE